MILKPPAVPRPSTGGAPKTLTRPSRISSCEPLLRAARRSRRRTAPARRGGGSRRASRTSRRSSGRWRSSRIDWPAMATVCLTPGVLPAISSICCITACGPLQRRRVGQLHVDQQVALVLRRDEAGGRLREAAVGQVRAGRRRRSSTSTLTAQQAADDAACRRRSTASKPG